MEPADVGDHGSPHAEVGGQGVGEESVRFVEIAPCCSQAAEQLLGDPDVSGGADHAVTSPPRLELGEQRVDSRLVAELSGHARGLDGGGVPELVDRALPDGGQDRVQQVRRPGGVTAACLVERQDDAQIDEGAAGLGVYLRDLGLGQGAGLVIPSLGESDRGELYAGRQAR